MGVAVMLNSRLATMASRLCVTKCYLAVIASGLAAFKCALAMPK